MAVQMEHRWMGRPIDELSRDELLTVVRHLAAERELTQKLQDADNDMRRLYRAAREGA